MPLAEPQPRADIPAGTYEATVQNVEPDIIVPRTGRNAGKDVPVLRWTWFLDSLDEEVESITSRDPSSEKSNLFKYFVALLGANRELWLKAETSDLVGRKALVTVSVDAESGYPRIDSVVAKPVQRAGVTPAEVMAAPAAAVADEPDNLPF